MFISQGEACDIEITLTTNGGAQVTPDIVADIEISLGNLIKTLSDGDIYYDGVWVFPLSQQETFRLSGVRPLTVRAKFTDETVGKASLCPVVIRKTKSRRVL